MLKEFIVQRLNKIKEEEKGFNPSLMRWANKSLLVQGDKEYIQEADFSKMTETELVSSFEYIIKLRNKQM